MSYSTSGLLCLSNASANSHWIYRTTDALAGVDLAGYFSDAGPASSGKGAAGRGLKVGDVVHCQVVDSISEPTAITAQSTGFISAISATTGAGTLIFNVTTAP